ncbi:hypothetical protein CHUAL_011742 [Chamberlinius hualienensis]
MAIGDYPAEYNSKVHGPYDPARYYGKPDTPLGEVKIGELAQWLGRRKWGPRPFAQACSRAYWRWQHKYSLPRYGGLAPYVQIAVGSAFVFYLLNYYKIKKHSQWKYH